MMPIDVSENATLLFSHSFLGAAARTPGLEAEIAAGNFTELGSGVAVAELLTNSRWTGDPKTVNAADDAPKMVFAKGNPVD